MKEEVARQRAKDRKGYWANGPNRANEANRANKANKANKTNRANKANEPNKANIKERKSSVLIILN